MQKRHGNLLFVAAGLFLLVMSAAARAQGFPRQDPPPRVVPGGPVLNVEASGTYRSIINSRRVWRAPNGNVTEETITCDVKATFHGGGSSRVEGSIRYLRQLKRGSQVLGTVQINGDGPVNANHSVRIGMQNAAQPGMEWVRWAPDQLEIPVTHTINSNAANPHTTYCEGWLKRKPGEFYPLKGSYSGPLSTVHVAVKPVITSNPPGQLIELNQTVHLEWDLGPLMPWPPRRSGRNRGAGSEDGLARTRPVSKA